MALKILSLLKKLSYLAVNADNLQELDNTIFDTDLKLKQDLVKFQVNSKPLGMLFISSNERCLLCASRMKVRKDRPSSLVIYDVNLGTVPGTQFYKYCTAKACGYPDIRNIMVTTQLATTFILTRTGNPSRTSYLQGKLHFPSNFYGVQC